MDEITAIRAYQSGDVRAFDVLFELHATHVYRTSYLIVRDTARADDVAQETFLILAQRLPSLAAAPLRSWLGRVAANLSLNDLRRARMIPLEMLSPAAEEEEERAQLRTAILALAPRQRAMIVLRYYADCPVAEIAAALGCRPATVRATLHQARRRLRGWQIAVDAGAVTSKFGRFDGGIVHEEG